MEFLRDLLTTPTTQLGRASRLLVFQIKLWSHCIRLLERNRAGQQAAALSYYTLFGLVPLAIVVLLIFQWLPGGQKVGEKLKHTAYEQLHLTKIEYYPDTESQDEKVMLTDYLDRIIDRFFGGLDKGSVSLISAVIVIWAAIALVSTIERSFNSIWHVSRGRGFLHRMINYWALLTLGPLLLGVGIYATTKYAALKSFETTILTHVGPIAVSYLVAVLAFFLLYFVLPNTKVQAGAALWSAAVAALVWSFAKFGFGQYVTEFIPYSKIYGVLGLIPLGVFWIHITWLIVLFGLQLTFTTQHLKTLDAAEIKAAKEKQESQFIVNDLTVINMVREVAEAFEQEKGPVSSEALCGRLDIPAEWGARILDQLVDKELLARTTEPRSGYVPARAAERIALSDITDAVAGAALAQPNRAECRNLEEMAQARHEWLRRYRLRDILTEPPSANQASSTAERSPVQDDAPGETTSDPPRG